MSAPDVEQLLRAAVYELDKAKIWGGMHYEYNPLAPMYYLKAKVLIEKALLELKNETN